MNRDQSAQRRLPDSDATGSLIRRAGQVLLGARLSLAGGRDVRVRLTMIALGVGLGVLVLFAMAAVPSAVAGRSHRIDARDSTFTGDREPDPSATSLLVAKADTDFRDHHIHGLLLQVEGTGAENPPGVDRRLGPGQMAASAALVRLLGSADGAELRGRWNATVVTTIASEGLANPNEYAFYLGTDQLDADRFPVGRIEHFGNQNSSQDMALPLLILATVGVLTMLLPVAVFVATAIRFGGASRDRQLAALRLVGADVPMARRIAAGETLVGALAGIAVGAVLFVMARWVLVTAAGSGLPVDPADIWPSPALVVIVVMAVLITSVLVTLSTLRRVVIEPLGVVHLTRGRRRRLLPRLLLPAVSLAMLAPLTRMSATGGNRNLIEFLVVGGMTTLLIGMATLLPWLVEATVTRLGTAGTSWQLAVRRLQVDSGTAVRAVTGIAISVACVIAVQTVLAGVEATSPAMELRHTNFDEYQLVAHTTTARGTMHADPAQSAAIATIAGIRSTSTVISLQARVDRGEDPDGDDTGRGVSILVGDCSVLGRYAVIERCTDGDTFHYGVTDRAEPGTALQVSGILKTTQSRRWVVPDTARRVVPRDQETVRPQTDLVLSTPAAIRDVTVAGASVTMYFLLDDTAGEVVDRIRTAVLRTDPLATVYRSKMDGHSSALATIKRALSTGALVLLLFIGASMVVNTLEQLRERSRLLAVLAAFGTRRSTIVRAILYQLAIPVFLGLGTAALYSIGLSAALLKSMNAPLRIDVAGALGICAGATAVVLMSAACTVPLVYRMTRPEALRTE